MLVLGFSHSIHRFGSLSQCFILLISIVAQFLLALLFFLLFISLLNAHVLTRTHTLCIHTEIDHFSFNLSIDFSNNIWTHVCSFIIVCPYVVTSVTLLRRLAFCFSHFFACDFLGFSMQDWFQIQINRIYRQLRFDLFDECNTSSQMPVRKPQPQNNYNLMHNWAENVLCTVGSGAVSVHFN